MIEHKSIVHSVFLDEDEVLEIIDRGASFENLVRDVIDGLLEQSLREVTNKGSGLIFSTYYLDTTPWDFMPDFNYLPLMNSDIFQRDFGEGRGHGVYLTVQLVYYEVVDD